METPIQLGIDTPAEWLEGKKVYSCDVAACSDKTFTTPSNLKKHWVNSHVRVRPLLQCRIKDCNFVGSTDGAFQAHLKSVHRYSFRDRDEAEKYCTKLEVENSKFVDPGATPRPAGLELSSVHKYWRGLGKATPAVMYENRENIVMAENRENDVVTENKENDLAKVVVQEVPEESTELEQAIAQILEPADNGTYIQQLHEQATIPIMQSNREYQPLPIPTIAKPTPNVRIISIKRKDPLDLETPAPKRRKEDVLKDLKKCDEEMELLRKKHAELKKELRIMENQEMEHLKKENSKLRQENAYLKESLVAARDVRRELDQEQRRQAIGAMPIGTSILRF